MGQTILKAADIKKVFPGVVALDGVRIEIERGEVHALLGENGAGKSTFLKILAGAQPSDGGSMVFDGQTLDPPTRRWRASGWASSRSTRNSTCFRR